MIILETDIEGKQTYFGYAEKKLEKFGFCLGGNWEYDSGIFDSKLNREGGETIYVRLPFRVLEGELDRRDAFIEFQKPYVIKHVVHIGLDKEKDSLLTTVGLSQFQEPVDKDGYIRDKSKWEEFGEEMIGDILNIL